MTVAIASARASSPSAAHVERVSEGIASRRRFPHTRSMNVSYRLTGPV
ncbi:hypothetical protein ACI2LO_08080 [Streptomyces sp. NPDC033754]